METISEFQFNQTRHDRPPSKRLNSIQLSHVEAYSSRSDEKFRPTNVRDPAEEVLTSAGHTPLRLPTHRSVIRTTESNIQFVHFVYSPEVEEEFCSWTQLTSGGATNRILYEDGDTACLRNTVFHFQPCNHFIVYKIIKKKALYCQLYGIQ